MQEQLTRLNRRSIKVAVFGAVVAALVVLPGLGLGTLWDNSETAYSEVAREILLTHDGVVMHMNAVEWYIQPPLFFWIAAGFSWLLSGSTLAYRLPAAIATIAISAYVALVVQRRAGSRAGRCTALVLSTSLMQAVIGRLAIMDAMLDAFVTVAMLAWFRAFASGANPAQRAQSFVVGSVAVALGMLTKGPVALAIPLIVLVPWAVYERYAARNATAVGPPRDSGGDAEHRASAAIESSPQAAGIQAPPRLAIGVGIIAIVAITLPWFIMLAARTGTHGLGELVMHYTVGRYLGTIENQTGPVTYYIPVILLGFFPWSAYLFPAIRDVFIQRKIAEPAPRKALAHMALAWSVIPFVFFSFGNTKLPNYLGLELPGLAILVGLWFDRAVVRARKTAFLTTLVLPGFLLALAIALVLFARSIRFDEVLQVFVGDLIAFFGAIFIGGVVAAAFLLRKKLSVRSPYALGCGVVIAMAVVSLVAAPQAEQFKPIPRLAMIINAQRQPGDLVANQGVGGKNGLLFYTKPPTIALDSPDVPPSSPGSDPALMLCTANRIFIVAPTLRPKKDPTYGRRRTTLAVDGKDTLFLIDGPPCPQKT